MKNYPGSVRSFANTGKAGTLLVLLCLFCIFAAPVTAQWTAERGSFRYAVVVRDDTYLEADWAEVVDSLVAKYSAEVFTYSGSIYNIQYPLSLYAPDYIAFVSEWDNATATFVDTVWKFGRGLDDDPYGDAIWGIITGYYASDALRLATGPEGFDVETVLGGTTSCDLTHYPRGISTSESTYGLYYTKALNSPEAVTHTDGPTDRTQWLVDCLNADSINIFVTSGHGAHYQWQMHYPTSGDEGYFRSYGISGCQALGRTNAGDTLHINSDNPKIFFGLGNCQIGKITNFNSMALGWLHTAGAYFYTGYVINEGSYSQQHGGTKAYFERQAHYTWPQAYYLANQALYYDKYNGTPGAGGAPDLNGSALYGDPAMEARVPIGVGVYDTLLYSEDVVVDSTDTPWEVTVTITMNIEGSPGYTSKWGYRSPIVLLPIRARDITVVSHNCKDVVVTDNFAIMHIWNKTEDPLTAGTTRELTFTCNPLTGISGGVQPFIDCDLASSPNPFSGSTVISFDLPERVPVTLEIFDITGRLVDTLISDDMPAGTNTVTWSGTSANQTPSGIYICRLVAGSRSYTARLVHLQ